jgi:hypothetical protein
MLLTFGVNWRNKFKATSIAKTNKFSQFKFGVKVELRGGYMLIFS